MVMVKGLMGRCLNHETTLDTYGQRLTWWKASRVSLKLGKSTWIRNLTTSKWSRRSLSRRRRQWKRSCRTRKRKYRTSGISFAGLRKRRYVNIASPMPCYLSLEAPSWRVSMMLSIKCKKPILTWTCPILRLTTKAKLPLCPSPPRVLRITLVKMQL